ncbi:MAG: cytochrome c peroxidase [Desulfuromonadales bacterium]|nr:cytochrome c peroxidase [Desulfuromonadales bacterium]
MQCKKITSLALASATLLLMVVASASANGTLTPQEELGKALFFDQNLSLNGNQSCATCHGPEVGWTGPDNDINAHGAVYEGSIPGAFGDRKPPTAAYGGDSPVLYYGARAGAWVGGMFWDGRATGWTLGDPLAEQALGPFLNPKEQALPNAAAVISIVQASDYADLFAEQCTSSDTNELYNCIGYAIAAYERSSEVSPFTSKYDYWLKGKAKLTSQEQLGRALFQGKAKCSACHVLKGKQPLFTDFTYDNLGIPKNLENPATIADPTWADPGLGGFLQSIGKDYITEIGKHKVPTLRNVDKRTPGLVKAYGHNGYFKSLEEIVHFYNTRDVPGAGWPPPEVAANLNTAEMGDLGLSPREEAAIVTFMKTLTDGWRP